MSETLIVTLTLTTVVTFLALLVGGMVGWLARQHSYDTTPETVYTHPEMFDENGNLSADEILAVRFENHDNNTEEEDND
jgi:heme A synthase